VRFSSFLVTGLYLCSALNSDGDSVSLSTAEARLLSVFRGTSRHINPETSGVASEDTSGTATKRLDAARVLARALNGKLTGDWQEVRKKLLGAAGLKDIPDKTGHCFTDFNHVSATTMMSSNSHNEHDGAVKGMAVGNQLGPGIESASLHEAPFDDNGSWCTCAIGAGKNPPFDVAHHQFHSKVAFYLVWLNGGKEARLATEEGELLACGQPTGELPEEGARKDNWDNFNQGGKIAEAAQKPCPSASLLAEKSSSPQGTGIFLPAAMTIGYMLLALSTVV